MDLKNLMDPQVKNEKTKYRLRSMIVHYGRSLKGGHYVCNALDKNDKTWFNYNDSVVKKIAEEKAILSKESKCNAYVLVYERIENEKLEKRLN